MRCNRGFELVSDRPGRDIIPPMVETGEEPQAHVERILRSDTFRSTEVLRRLLRFLAAKAFSGEADGFDYMAAVEVQSFEGVPPELNVVTMPTERYAVFAHRGHISKLQDTCRAIEREWLPKSRYSLGLGTPGSPGFFERYGESFDPKVGVGDVEVWVPIR